MDTDSIKKRIRNLINAKFEINEEISDTDYLVNFGLGVDSVSSLEFVVALEKEYGIEIDESEITPDILKNINSISDYLSKKL